MMYLHEKSGLGIYHELGILKPSKVLLDGDMNPKIIDAGIPPPGLNMKDYTFVFRPYDTYR